MTEYPIIVCGGRRYRDAARVAEVLSDLTVKHGMLHIIQGGADGADRLAREWCLSQPYCHLSNVPANWAAHGKSAGPTRNQRMLDEYQPLLVVAFPGGRGTDDMIRRAKAAGVQVFRA